MKYGSEQLEKLLSFEDEASLIEHLQSGPGFTSLPSSPLTYSSPVFTQTPNNSNFRSERGKEIALFDDEMIYSTNYYQEHISFHPPNQESPNGTATEAGTSSHAVESLLDTCGLMDTFDVFKQSLEDPEELDRILNYVSTIHFESITNECHATSAMMGAQTVSVCTIARKRWTKVSKLMRRNSVRERISLSQGIPAHKKQRCC